MKAEGKVDGMERDTAQRRAIRAVFDTSDRPMTPAEILSGAQVAAPSLGIATVYRTLKVMVDSGWLTAVELPGEPPRYERAGKGHHHHFHCRSCGKVFEIQGCPGNLAALTPQGFLLETHEIFLFGQCAECIHESPVDQPAS